MDAPLQRTLFVSFPRSGHHLAVRLLSRYFSRDLQVLREGYELPGLLVASPFVWCEFYRHCQTVGCVDPRVTAQKSHDFDLRLVPPEGWQVVVQLRNPVPAIASHYRLLVSQGKLWDSYLTWRYHLYKDLRYYRRFVEKWICGPLGQNALLLEYDALLEAPAEQLCRLAHQIAPGRPVDRAFAERVVAVEKVARRSHLRAFPYYEPSLARAVVHRLFPTGHSARRRLPLHRWEAQI